MMKIIRRLMICVLKCVFSELMLRWIGMFFGGMSFLIGLLLSRMRFIVWFFLMVCGCGLIG